MRGALSSRMAAVAVAYAAIVMAMGSMAMGATMTISATAPTPDADDLFFEVTVPVATQSGQDSIALDGQTQGQTFTTSAASSGGYLLNSITIKGGSTLARIKANLVLGVRVTQLIGTDISVVQYDTAVIPTTISDSAFDDYMTFVLASPVALAANTSYGFDFSVDSNPNNETQFFFQMDKASLLNGDPGYAGGQYYRSVDGSVATLVASDRTFYLDLTAVPEPATMSLLGVGALVLARRRRETR